MNPKIPWSIAGVLAAACLFLSFAEVKQALPPAPQVVTKEVVREVPSAPKVITKEVIREVPADIPPEYKAAMDFVTKVVGAKTAAGDEALSGVRGIKVSVEIPEGLRGKVQESELKDTIELELRKNGIPLNSDSSDHYLHFSVDGFWNDEKLTFTYNATLSLYTSVYLFPNGSPKRLNAQIWRAGYVGFAGSSKVVGAVSGTSTKLITMFSNRYLAQNPR